MTNNSSTGGYLQPNPAPAPQPLEGQALQDFIQEIVVGITGLDGTMVRPRYQSEPAVIPDAGTAWCAIGVGSRKSDTFPYVAHQSGATLDDGDDYMQRQEQLEIIASFYDLGVNGLADQYASLLRDGLLIAQNLEVLQANGWGLGYTGDLSPVPVVINTRWQYRVDLVFNLRRQIDRTYPILNIKSAQGTIQANSADSTTFTDPFAVNPPQV